MSRRVKGMLLLLAGAIMLFFGAVGAFNLIDKNQQTGYVGEEVPRDMIEAGYEAAFSQTGQSDNQGNADLPVFVPANTTPDHILPTLAAVHVTDVDLSEDPTPDEPPVVETPDIDAPESISPEEEEVVPRWIFIKAIGLDAPIIPATSTIVEVEEDGKTYQLVQWEAPDEAAAGWHSDSAPLGQVGNTILNGHHNVYGRVFGSLAYLQEGDFIQIYGSDKQWYTYVVANKMVLPEEGVSLQKRMENATWILPSTDERLTLITCWPEQTNTHRLIIVAQPVDN